MKQRREERNYDGLLCTNENEEVLNYYCFCCELDYLTSFYNITTLRAALFNDNTILGATECCKKYDAYLIALAIEKYYEPHYIENRTSFRSNVESKYNVQLNASIYSIYDGQRLSNKDIEKLLIKILEKDNIIVNEINIL